MKPEARITRIRKIVENAERRGVETALAWIEGVKSSEWREIRQLVNVGKPRKPKELHETFST